MSQLGMRLMGSRNALLSVYSTAGVALLHLVHYLSAPILMGSTTEMHAHHMSGHASTGGGSTLLMNILMLLLFMVNLVSMYFAARQLNEAYRHRSRSQFTRHTLLCSSISVLILAIGIYTIITL